MPPAFKAFTALLEATPNTQNSQKGLFKVKPNVLLLFDRSCPAASQKNFERGGCSISEGPLL